MIKYMRVIIASFIACLLMAMPVMAADNELTAEYKNGHYTLDMAIDTFFQIPDLEFDKVYSRTLRFDNDSNKRLKIGMVDVYNNIDDARIYDRSTIKIKIDDTVVYDGSMHDARWSAYVNAGDSILVAYDYCAIAPDHIPDNSWMRAEMASTFVFVGEYEKASGGSGSSHSHHTSNHSSIDPTVGETESDNTIDDTSNNRSDNQSNDDEVDIIIKLPDTGDHSHTELLWWLILLSGSGALMLYLSDRKRKNKTKSES